MKADEEAALIIRIFGRAAELMVEHDGWPVHWCVAAAEFEDRLIYGVPGGRQPAGILNSPGVRLDWEKR